MNAWHARRTAVIGIVVVAVGLVNAGTAVAQTVVSFPDAALEAAVRDAIDKPEGDILDTDLVGLLSLTATGLGGEPIRDLSGIEYCVDLVAVDLSRNEIVDVAPLAGLTQLWTLNLAYNDVSDITALGVLGALRVLALSGNEIADVSALANLDNLEALDVSLNRLTDISPLASLAGLAILGLSGNQIADVAPLTSLTALTELYVGGNAISDVSPLSPLTGLEKLNVAYNTVSDVASLSALTGLESLDLSHNAITGLSGLGAFINLTQLRIEDNPSGDVAAALESIPALAYLGISDNQVAGIDVLSGYSATMLGLFLFGPGFSDLTALSSFSALQSLGLHDIGLADLDALAGLGDLKHLSLPGNQIADLTALAGLTRLVYLDVSDNQLADLDPLSTFESRLVLLNLAVNQVTDIAPLLGPGFVFGEGSDAVLPEVSKFFDVGWLADLENWLPAVNLSCNPLGPEAIATDIPALESLGVAVLNDPATCSQPVTITTPSPLPVWAVGIAYTYALAAVGDSAPYTWSLVSGELPPGLSLEGDTGTISGTPTVGNTYAFRVRATGLYGQFAEKDLELMVDALPTAAFGASPVSGEAPLTVKFTDQSIETYWQIQAWHWGFGDGQTSNEENPAYTYDEPGTYTVSLTVYSDLGSDTETKPDVITVKARPEPLTISTVSPLRKGTVGMDYRQTFSATGGTPPYLWSVVSGSVPPGLTLAETGILAGVPTTDDAYAFRVRVVGSGNREAEKDFALTIQPEPVAGPSAAFSATPRSGKTPLTVQFADESVAGSAAITSWAWSFGDGGLSTEQNPSHTYTMPASYTVTLVVATAVGSDTNVKEDYVTVAEDPEQPPTIATVSPLVSGTVDVAYSETLTATRGTAPYTWSLASGSLPPGLGLDGATGEIDGTPTAAGRYAFRVRVTDANGHYSESSFSLTIRDRPPLAPTAAFAATPASGHVSLNVQFADESTPGSGEIISWLWSFGDGTSSVKQNPTHIYETPGTYTVTLTVTTIHGSDSVTREDYITVMSRWDCFGGPTGKGPPGDSGGDALVFAAGASLLVLGGTRAKQRSRACA